MTKNQIQIAKTVVESLKSGASCMQEAAESFTESSYIRVYKKNPDLMDWLFEHAEDVFSEYLATHQKEIVQ